MTDRPVGQPAWSWSGGIMPRVGKG